jgi:hypothetical protein
MQIKKPKHSVAKKPEISTLITPTVLPYFMLQFLPFNGEHTGDISKLGWSVRLSEHTSIFLVLPRYRTRLKS